MNHSSPYNGSLTREQFLFHEMRIAAKLLDEGLSESEVVEEIVNDNLFQFPTERMVKNLARVCVRRLKQLEDDSMVRAVAMQPFDVAKQICLFAMMKDNRLVWDFMITVIGEKYRTLDMSFSKADLNTFFMRLQDQDEKVASWTDSTIKKIKSVLTSVLVENDYLDDYRSEKLNPVLIEPILENYITATDDTKALQAFNCLY